MNTDKFSGIEGLIGRTPLLEIHYTYKNRPGRIFAKAEYLNMTGSIKDRVAVNMIEDAEKKGYEKGL